MYNIFNFVCADTNKEAATWVVNSFPIIKIVILCLLLILSIAMIVMIVMQKSNTNGVSAISGQSDTFYNRNKKGTLQGLIKKLTIIDAILILVLCVAFLVIHTIFEGTI